ncbi:MAG TPA: glycosyltransferase, partial [Opitutaceae bacterium]
EPGPFNDYRLPSKLPEFFAAGRPIILPRTNLGREVVDGVEGVLLSRGTPEEIADLCQRIFEDDKLASKLSENAALFSRSHFNLEAIVDRLLHFYIGVYQRPSPQAWKTIGAFGGSEIGVLAEHIQQSAAELPSTFRDQLELLGLLVRELESSLSVSRRDAATQELQKQVAYWKGQYDLTKQHLDHVEKTFALTARHADSLQSELNSTRAELNQTEQIRKATEAKLREAQKRGRELSAETLALKTEVARLDELVIRGNILQRDLVYQRDEKIRQLTSSFSWKATAWLRALRRLLLDPVRKKTAKPAPLPEPAPHQRSRLAEAFGQVSASCDVVPSFRYCLDYPQVWSFRPSKLVARGWCFAADGSPITALRARVGDRVYPAVIGLKRLDVLAALREYPQAEYCGFKIDLEVTLSDTEIVLEAAGESGKFYRFAGHVITVTENGGVEELTSYQKWIETYDTLSLGQRDAQRAEVERWTNPPLVSIVLPVYNTPEKWLRKAVDSVKAQTYRHWELCIADDASPNAEVKPLLQELEQSDSRIKIVYREKNGHISSASNSALEIATGEFVALLDHDDEITPDALFEIVSAFRTNPQAELVYSDEDKIDEEGRRLEPYFKPDYLPDLYLGQNYISHLSVYRLQVVRAVGGFRVGYEGSQDWDLALRVIDLVGGEKVVHVPKILYHWRAIPGSTALLISEKNYPLEAARKALTDHFARQRQPVALVTVPGDHWRAKYPIPSPAPRVALIIPTRNRVNLLRQCVESILAKTTYPNFEVVVVDNASNEPDTLAYFADLQMRKMRVLAYPGDFNYSAINNFAVQQVDAEIVGLLNNDLEVIHGDWLDEMVSQAARPEIGCVGAMLYYPNDRVQHAGVIVGLGGVAGHAFRDFPRGTPGAFNRARLAQNYSAVTAACLLVRRSIYLKVGGLDEKELAVAFNDIDFCLKVRAAGFRNIWTPFAELYHHESASRGAEDTPEKHERFRREVETMLERWRAEIAHDPAYNPNLTLELNDFSLAAPPRIKSSAK